MINYTVEDIFYPETGETKLALRFQEGDYEGALVRVDKFESSEDNMIDIDYTLLEGPEGLVETNSDFVEDFKVVMESFLEKVIQSVSEEENDNCQ